MNICSIKYAQINFNKEALDQMHLTHHHQIAKLLGRNAYLVYSLLCLAEMDGIAPVGRRWLVENMAGPISPSTVTLALRVLTSEEIHLATRVAGGWRLSGQAFQPPLAQQRLEKDSESTKYSDNTKYPDSTKNSQNTNGGGGVESKFALSTITPPPPPINLRGKKVPGNTKAPDKTKPPNFLACMDTLREYCVVGRKAEQIAELEWVTPEYIRAHMEQTRQEGDELKSPVGLAVYRIQEGAPLPKKRVRRDEDDRSRYITGKYADIIQH